MGTKCLMTEHTTASGVTRAAEKAAAGKSHEADRPATDDEAIKEVDFYLDGSNKAIRLTQAPYTFVIKGSSGSTHTLTVQAYDYNPSNAPAVQMITVNLP